MAGKANQELLAQFSQVAQDMCQAFKSTSQEQIDALVRNQSELLEKLGDTIAKKLTPQSSSIPHQSERSSSSGTPVIEETTVGINETLQVSTNSLNASNATNSGLLAHPYPIGHFVGDASSGLTVDDQDIRAKSAFRRSELSRLCEGLNKNTFSLRDINKSYIILGYGLEELHPLLNSPLLSGSLEEARTLLGLPLSHDLSPIAELMSMRNRAVLAYLDVQSALKYDQQIVQVVQSKSYEYLKAFKGNHQLHENTVKRIEVVDRHLARIHVAANREKKKTDEKHASFKPKYRYNSVNYRPQKSFTGTRGSSRFEPYSTFNGRTFNPNHEERKCFSCGLTYHPGFPCAPKKS